MKNRVLCISLAVVIVLSANLIGCGGEVLQEYSLTISTTEGGSVTSPGQPGPYTYDEGEVVSLVAKADEGYQFAGWTGDVGEIADVEDSTTTITMNDDYSITATFAVKQYNIVTHSTEGGSVTTPGEGTYTYDKGEVVNLVAVADEDYQFISWTGDVITIADVNAASTTITMNGGYSITANFAGTIRDWYDLDAIRNNLDGSYSLMNDLDSNTAGYTELASPTANGGKGWQPIGDVFVDSFDFGAVNPVDAFTGSLDGQGYEISGLFIDRAAEDGLGLFSCIGAGVIDNVGVVNAAIVGRSYVGGLVGWALGTVSRSFCTGSVSGDQYVGGLVGGSRWDSDVEDSYSAGSVTGSIINVGGLVGGNGGTVSDSYSTASVTGGGHAGGLVGSNWHAVSNSYSTGSVTGDWNVGGLTGWNHGGTLSNSYSTGSVTGNGPLGGLVGQNHDGTVSNSYYNYDDVLINGRNIITIGALFNDDFDQWLANDMFLDVNTRLSKEGAYHVISDVSDFRELLAFGQNTSLKFRLKNDLNLATEPNFYIPYLAGEFDGNGRRIANLSFSSDFTVQVGLFGYLAAGGKVSAVSAENVNMTAHGIVGGLVGENDGTVSNSYFTGRVAGYQSVGGLVGCVGWNGGTVSNSYYNYDEVLINGRNIITIGALFNDDFDQWLANDEFLDVNERLGQEDGYYLINGVADFKELLAFGQDASLKFKLKSDLDLSSHANFYVPYFAGEFDGNGHRISNLRLNFDSIWQVGLFGYLAPSGTVSEVGVENTDVTVTGYGNYQVGGLVGGSVGSVTSVYSTGSVNGNQCVGGLVGWNKGTVRNSCSTVGVAGYGFVGGLVGWNYEDRPAVSNSYSTGSVTDGDPVGGLIGAGSNDTVNNCFWDTNISGIATSAGGIGRTTMEMKNIATFSGAGWSIVAVAPGERNIGYAWNIVDGQTYPFPSWQP